MQTKQWTDANWIRRHGLVYKCQLSYMYHRKRERFFALCDKLAAMAALIAGLAAISDLLLPSAPEKAIAGAAVVLFTLPGLVFGWADRARNHAILATRFNTLHAEIEGAGVLDDSFIDALVAKAVVIEDDEPPQLSALTRICQNELAFTYGQPDRATPMNGFSRMMAHFIDSPKMA